MVLVETRILDRQYRLLHHRRNLLYGQILASLLTEFANQLAIGRPDPQRLAGAVIGQSRDVRELGERNSQQDREGQRQ